MIIEPTKQQRDSGVWSIRHSRSSQTRSHRYFVCCDCGWTIWPGQTYWRRYGKMGEAVTPFTAYTCEACESRWKRRYGDAA